MRILVVTGASGGHIFPSLSFLDTLEEKHSEVRTLLVAPRSVRVRNIPLDKYNVKFVTASKLTFNFSFKAFFGIFNFLKCSLESLNIFIEFRPDIVVGFGSLDTIPLMLIAWLARVRTLIHEQNVLPGRANRLLAKFSDKVAVSFLRTKDYLGISSCRIVVTGNPIRKELQKIDRLKALDFFGFDGNKFTILVMGGSLGSKSINDCFLKAASLLTKKEGLQVIHICGSNDFSSLEEGWKDIKIKVRLFPFLRQMQYAYSVSDLAVSRAGATTICELINFGLPAILIPYPFAYAHQSKNAGILGEAGSAVIMNDSQFNAGDLADNIEQIMSEPGKLEGMRSGYNIFPKGFNNERLVEEVLSLNG